jgi:hypothetical protein
MQQIVDETKVAEIMDVAVQTLRNWRFQRKGPPYIKFGRSVRYTLGDIEEYISRHQINPEKERS